jgi:hypothetical protein
MDTQRGRTVVIFTTLAKTIAVAGALTVLATCVIGAKAEARPRNDVRQLGGRPTGCPHAYCGCGLARFLGLTDTRLNLAWNWAKLFPHVGSPQPGAVAVRHGHVFQLVAHAGGSRWVVRDYNSGGGKSRIHIRDVGGRYVFVQPRIEFSGARV